MTRYKYSIEAYHPTTAGNQTTVWDFLHESWAPRHKAERPEIENKDQIIDKFNKLVSTCKFVPGTKVVITVCRIWWDRHEGNLDYEYENELREFVAQEETVDAA